MINHKTAIAVAKAFALMLVASSAHAQVTNLVTNGSFEQTTFTRHHPATPTGANWLAPNSLVSGVNGWTTTASWAFVQTTENGVNALWNNTNGGSTLVTPSPDGGNWVHIDADPTYGGRLSQNVSGLTPGASYNLSFYSALGQEVTNRGSTWDYMNVSLGSQHQLVWGTPGNPTKVPARGFTGWQSFNLTFKATAATETLSFLAVGGPNGVPPIALLDGVSLVAAVPEPEEWAMMLVGGGLVSWQVRRKQAKIAA